MILTKIEENEFERYFSNFAFSSHIKDKTFLITGSKGMTSEAIIKWLLLEKRNHNANCNIIASTRNPQVIPDYVETIDQIEFIKFGSEREYITGKKVDYIIHAAAPTGREFFISKPVETLRVIVDGTENMIEIARASGASMVYLSSVEAYGIPNTNELLKETYVGAVDSLNIRNGYPMGKKAAEFLCYASSKEYGLDIKIVRPSSIHGLFQPYTEQRIFNEVLRFMIENKNLIMKSNGLSKKSIVYTLDVVTGILTALFLGKKGEVYNITNPDTFMTMRDLVNTLFQQFRPNLKIEYDIQAESNTGYLPHLSFSQDISKLKFLGWTPITPLKKIYEIDLGRFTNDY